jgi:hypothetical protein
VAGVVHLVDRDRIAILRRDFLVSVLLRSFPARDFG